MTNESERAKFEAWRRNRFINPLERDPESGRYRGPTDEERWQTWLASSQYSGTAVALNEIAKASEEALCLLEQLDPDHGITVQLMRELNRYHLFNAKNTVRE